MKIMKNLRENHWQKFIGDDENKGYFEPYRYSWNIWYWKLIHKRAHRKIEDPVLSELCEQARDIDYIAAIFFIVGIVLLLWHLKNVA